MTLSVCSRPNGTEHKGGERQNGVGLAIKEKIIQKDGKAGIAIRTCPKGSNFDASNFVTFVVAYTPTEEAAEGQKTK